MWSGRTSSDFSRSFVEDPFAFGSSKWSFGGGFFQTQRDHDLDPMMSIFMEKIHGKVLMNPWIWDFSWFQSDSYHFQNPNQGAAIWFSPAIVNVCSSASHGCESTPFLVVEIHFYI